MSLPFVITLLPQNLITSFLSNLLKFPQSGVRKIPYLQFVGYMHVHAHQWSTQKHNVYRWQRYKR